MRRKDFEIGVKVMDYDAIDMLWVQKVLIKRKDNLKMTPSLHVKIFDLYMIYVGGGEGKNTHKHHVYVYYLPYLICLWANKSK